MIDVDDIPLVIPVTQRLAKLHVIFFFQAEDGIRDKLVTGVQTCALPISSRFGNHVASPTNTNPSSRPGMGAKWLVSTPLGITAQLASGAIARRRARSASETITLRAQRPQQRRSSRSMSRAWWERYARRPPRITSAGRCSSTDSTL